MTHELPWDLRLTTDFLESGRAYEVEVLWDGPNADRQAEDFVHESLRITGGDDLAVRMAAGGGWAAVVRPL